MSAPETTLVALDGRDAVAAIIIRPADDTPSGFALEAWAKGISKKHAAHYLRYVANLWDPS